VGYEGKIIRLLKALYIVYKETFSAVRVDGEISEWFLMVVGLLQGCVLSLFVVLNFPGGRHSSITGYGRHWGGKISGRISIDSNSPTIWHLQRSVNMTCEKWKVSSGQERPFVTTMNHCRFPGSAHKEVVCHSFPPDLP